MTGPGYTQHAQSRAQQRAIPGVAVGLIMRFGRVQRHQGADVFSLDRKARKSVRSYLGTAVYRGIEDHLGIYVVLGDAGRVITIAHRTDRLKNA